MNTRRMPSREWFERIILALLFISIGYLIYFIFSPFRPQLKPINDYLGRFCLAAVLLLMTLLAGKSARYRPYQPIFLGLLIMIIAVSLDWVSAIYLIKNLGVDGSTITGSVLQKINEFVVIVITVISLTLLSGGSLRSIYIQKGNLKTGLAIGGLLFLLAAIISTSLAEFLFKGQNLTISRILPWLPWLLIFVLANAAEEELLFRGLFLRKLEPFYGKFLSNAMIAFVFSFLHYGVNYTSDNLMFLIGTTVMALAWGALMQKTDSIWGSILFHAGMDIPILLGIFSNM
ncbi:MAG: CPBP family intramembrane metalloprotease [Anaerolineales bacterium]|nr:CPBP family intramembrane metalloprotease [Anaerolineales bacterium]